MPSTGVVGVDLIEIKKAREFLREHRRRLGSFFRARELAYIFKNWKNAPVRLAEILAAKEAVFKARGAAWMGAGGFRGIRVLSDKRNFRRALSVARSRDYVVAQFRAS